tara:strand:+ start:877 stop:1098 length:222 start_codon:yes stop_codon:yes gene_type:complete
MNLGEYNEKIGCLVIREITFKEYCDRHDENFLEYDLDDAWDHWQRMGPCFEVMKEGKLVVVWPPIDSSNSKKS